jgi:arylformamidase
MKAEITINDKKYKTDLSKPIDISISLAAGNNNVIAWYAPPLSIEPVRMGSWVGEVAQGASVNFKTVTVNPHAHGTHTECVGHITKEFVSLNKNLKTFFFLAELITVKPMEVNGDLIIFKEQLQALVKNPNTPALVIRTLPNLNNKQTMHYSNTNPAYLHHQAAAWMVENQIQHLLIDLPSVDKEKDEGKLLAHHAFWNTAIKTRYNATITELIYVDDEVKDGQYLLNLQITSLENDASPSKPLLFSFE